MSPRLIRASLLYGQRRYLEAESELREALSNGERSADLHAMLGLCLRQASLHEAAVKEGKRALEIDPNSAYAHYAFSYIAEIHTRQRRLNLSPCIKHVQTALAIAPQEVRYLVRLAELYQAMRKWRASLEPLDAAMRIDPVHVGAAVLRAEALIHLGRRREARETLIRSLESEPEAATAHAGMGWTLLRAGEHARATEFFDEALRLHPELDWAQAGAIECAKQRYWLYRLISWPSRRLPHLPVLRALFSLGGVALPVGLILALLIWLDPVLRPKIGGTGVCLLFVTPLILAISFVNFYDAVFFWLVRKHRSSKSTTGERQRKQMSHKLLIVVLGVSLGLGAAIFEHVYPTALAVSVGILPGLAGLVIALSQTPRGVIRNRLIGYSAVLTIAGPVAALTYPGFFQDLGGRGCVALIVLAMLPVIIADARVKKKDQIQRHRLAVESSRRKLEK